MKTLFITLVMASLISFSVLSYYGGGYYGGFNSGLNGWGAGFNAHDYRYGNKDLVDFNLNVCRGDEQENCTADYPHDELVWRFVNGLGWRKMSRFGAARKDWWDYSKTWLRSYRRYQRPPYWRY